MRDILTLGETIKTVNIDISKHRTFITKLDQIF
jgi:hypothetical protein